MYIFETFKRLPEMKARKYDDIMQSKLNHKVSQNFFTMFMTESKRRMFNFDREVFWTELS